MTRRLPQPDKMKRAAPSKIDMELLRRLEELTDPEFLRRVDQLLAIYVGEVQQSELSMSSKSTYIDFADSFVRWAKGEFRPGVVKGRTRPAYNKGLPVAMLRNKPKQ